MVIYSELGDALGIAGLFEAIMQIAISRGHLKRALRLAAAAIKLREDFSLPLPPREDAELRQSLASIRADLGEPASEIVWREGCTMATEKAIQFALSGDIS